MTSAVLTHGYNGQLPAGPINKTDRYDITEILLKVALNIITITLFEVLAIIQFEFLTMSYDQLSTLL
jgi:hypothetical protein